MAQEIVTWCDVHMNRGERVPARPITGSLDGGKPHVIDLCEACEKEIVEPFRQLLADGRVLGEQAKRTPGGNTPGGEDFGPADASGREYVCPICADLGVAYSTKRRGRIRDHVRAQHGRNLPELESERGETVDGLPLRFACDAPGCGLKFSHAQGLGAHKRHVHHVEGGSKRTAQRRDEEGQGALVV